MSIKKPLNAKWYDKRWNSVLLSRLIPRSALLAQDNWLTTNIFNSSADLEVFFDTALAKIAKALQRQIEEANNSAREIMINVRHSKKPRIK